MSDTIWFFAIVATSLVMVVLAVSVIAAIFKKWELHDHPHALGLPEGSVRAILALGLLLIFVGSSFALFRGLDPGPPQLVAANLSSSPSDLPDNLFATTRLNGSNEQIHEVWMMPDHSAKREFALQILIAITTALASVTGFYFGNRSTSAAYQEFAERYRHKNPE